MPRRRDAIRRIQVKKNHFYPIFLENLSNLQKKKIDNFPRGFEIYETSDPTRILIKSHSKDRLKLVMHFLGGHKYLAMGDHRSSAASANV